MVVLFYIVIHDHMEIQRGQNSNFGNFVIAYWEIIIRKSLFCKCTFVQPLMYTHTKMKSGLPMGSPCAAHGLPTDAVGSSVDRNCPLFM